MDLGLAAEIIKQAGQALTAAHNEGIIHCDLKPENIMLQDLGEGEYQVKIVDFGVAKVKNSQVADQSPGTSVAGSAFYMAPEQYEGRPCQESDIFALGVIVYEMVTGRRPFNPPTQYRVLETIRAGVRIYPKDLRPEIPDKAQELILKSLSYDPAARPQRARDFGEALADALTATPQFPTGPETGTEPDLELAHVLAIDLIGSSTLSTEQQNSVLKRVQSIVNSSEPFNKAKAANQLISRSTGDGIVLAFFSGPRAPAECSLAVGRALRSQPEIKVRMGINSGPVYRVRDLNQAGAATGAGINVASHIMSCGDAGHILASQSAADVLGELSEWRERLHDLGIHKVDSGAALHLFNVYDTEAGNSAIPKKLGTRRHFGLILAGAGIIALLALAGVVAVKLLSPGGPAVQPPAAPSRPVAGAQRSLNYSLTVQKYRDNKKDGAPFTLADANQIFESKYHVKLNVTTPQPGFFYILNEGPPDPNGAPRYNMLYPANADKGNRVLTRITAPEPADDWFEFDNRRGTEKLWLVWSEAAVPELEAVKGLANQEAGQIKDAEKANAVHQMLARYGASKLEKVTDQDAKQTTLTGSGSVLVYPLNLEHQ
jgi:class 3 adenylate cyclase